MYTYIHTCIYIYIYIEIDIAKKKKKLKEREIQCLVRTHTPLYIYPQDFHVAPPVHRAQMNLAYAELPVFSPIYIYFCVYFLYGTINTATNHLDSGLVVRTWNQEVCSFCGLRFETCGCSYDSHWRLTWSLTSGPVELVEVGTNWPNTHVKLKNKHSD